MCNTPNKEDGFCYECLYANCNVFGQAVCTLNLYKVVGWYAKACNDFKYRYSEIVNENTE